MGTTFDIALIAFTILTLMFSAIIPMGGYTPANVPNPWNDLSSGFGLPTAVTGSSTTSQTQNPQNVQHTAALQGCVLGGLAGAAAGALIGGALGLGVGAIPGAVVGFFGFGALGCAIGGGVGNSFPTTTTQLFSSIVQSTGPIGLFLQGVLTVLQYVYPFIQFIVDWIPYEMALAQYEPALAAILAAVQTPTALMWFMFGAKLFRGVGSLG